MTQDILQRVSADRIRRDLFHLCHSPLRFRKVNYTRPGQNCNSLAEADAYIGDQLRSAGYEVVTTTHRVQAFRCDRNKPMHHWYSKPQANDPWFGAANLEVVRRGRTRPDEIIQLVSHKDSMSWIDSPGAYDNATGTVANLELGRILASCDLRRSVRILFCNEEHTPWTSRSAAEAAAARGDRIIAVLNQDGIGGKSEEDVCAGRLTHVVCYSTDEGKALAEFVVGSAARHRIELDVRAASKQPVNDDDGMFINAGFRAAVLNIGSWPFADEHYHLPGDVPERVNIENVVRSTQLLLGAILDLDSCDAATAWATGSR